MFCTKCGCKNDDDSLFCAGCGAKLSKPQFAQNIGDFEKTDASGQQMTETFTDNWQEGVSKFGEEAAGQKESFETVTSQFGDFSQDVQESISQDSGFGGMQDYMYSNDIPQQTLSSDVDPSPANPEQFGFDQFQSNPVQYGFDQFQSNPVQSGFDQFQSGTASQTMDTYQSNQAQQDSGSFQSGSFSQPSVNQQFGTSYAANTQAKNKFSFKRFWFSLIVILASFGACAGIALNFVGFKMKAMGQTEYEKSKGYDIIKDSINIKNEETKDLAKTAKTFRILLIAFEAVLVVFALIDFITLIAVRTRKAYVFTMLFSLIKGGLGGFMIYYWLFNFLDALKDAFQNMIQMYLSSSAAGIEVTATIEIGAMLAVGLQALIFVCSIILMTCKNRVKA